jgi:hypothetical protein
MRLFFEPHFLLVVLHHLGRVAIPRTMIRICIGRALRTIQIDLEF